MRAGVAQGGLVSPVLFSLYVNDVHTPSRNVVPAQYADDTALVATSRSPSFPVGFLKAYLDRMVFWQRTWRIAINVLKITAVFFVKTQPKAKKNEVSRTPNTIAPNSALY